MVKLLLGTHSHQPVGNFDHVFEWAYRKAYRPFIDVAEKYPGFKLTLHFTGPLMEWFERKHPDFNDRIAGLVEKKQAEIVVSGFYEPVLWSIPHRDRLAQIEKAVDFVEKRYGYRPAGLWLTERVWEADVVRSIVEAGLKYVLVDDFHFLCAGKKTSELHGYYLTEYEGKTLAIFPIDQKLRYLIPFRPIHEVMNYLRELENNKFDAAIIFDDGEKFGVWPGTYDWVYDKGWLELFMETILKTPWVETKTYTEFMAEHPPAGRIYLPSASYFEMSEWSLPAERALEFSRFIGFLESQGKFDEFKQFVRGGTWPNFLVKYEESNRMHKKMLYLSEIAWKKGDPEAIEAVHRAQCNDAYWHGVFGGLYLPHLRHAIYANLLTAEEKTAPIPSIEVIDLDKDGHDEIIIRNREFSIQIAPFRGGGVVELSSFAHKYNLNDTLRRRFEHYHEGIHVGESGGHEGVASIHEISKRVDTKTYAELKYDWHERLSFIEHILPDGVGLREFKDCSFHDLGDFTLGEYGFEIDGLRARLYRKGFMEQGDRRFPVEIGKIFKLDGSSLRVKYAVNSEKGLKLGVELNLSLPSSDNPETVIKGDGTTVGSPEDRLDLVNIRAIQIQDTNGMKVSIESDRNFEAFVVPIYTVSQSESGFDLTYQETAVLLIYSLPDGENGFEIKLGIE